MAADRLRFRSPPQTEVGFFGSPERESVSGSDRTNLPEPVQAGVDYRDVRVAYRLATALCDPAGAAEAHGRRPERRRGPRPDGADPDADRGSGPDGSSPGT